MPPELGSLVMAMTATVCTDQQRIAALEAENKALREALAQSRAGLPQTTSHAPLAGRETR